MASTDIVISVIVPVYRIEDEYLDACLASLAAQTSGALEFVIVDDGSTPENAAMIDAYAEKDPRFVPVHAANAGAATARNEGLDVARGQWINFVDADDLVVGDFLSLSVPVLEQCQDEVVFFEFSRDESVDVPDAVPSPEPLCATSRDVAQALLHARGIPELDQRFYLSTPWAKFFRRSWLEEHDVRFPDGVAKTHDTVFMLAVAAGDPRWARLDATGYVNRLRETSMSHKPYPNIAEVYDDTVDACRRVIEERYPKAEQPQLLAWLDYLQYCFMRIGAGRKVYAGEPLAPHAERLQGLRELTEHYDEPLSRLSVSEARDWKDAIFLGLHKAGAYELLDLAYLKWYGLLGANTFEPAPTRPADGAPEVTSRRVMAGIVTYNPDLDRLRENIEAVFPQVEHVFVLDNGSGNQAQVIELGSQFPNVEVLPSPENLGLSKALNTLGAACEAGGAAWAFFLDQDSVTSPNMVESLLDTAMEAQWELGPVGQVGPTIFERNLGLENIKVEGAGDYEETRMLITSGSLVNLEAWRVVDGYDEDLFLDWVDIAFSFALRQAGYAVVLSSRTRMLHEMGEREPLFHFPAWLGSIHMPFTFKEEDGRQVLFRFNYAPFRWYDQMRSMSIVADKYRGTDDAAFVREMMLGTSLRGVAFEKDHVGVAKALWHGLRDGRSAAARIRRRDAGQGSVR